MKRLLFLFSCLSLLLYGCVANVIERGHKIEDSYIFTPPSMRSAKYPLSVEIDCDWVRPGNIIPEELRSQVNPQIIKTLNKKTVSCIEFESDLCGIIEKELKARKLFRNYTKYEKSADKSNEQEKLKKTSKDIASLIAKNQKEEDTLKAKHAEEEIALHKENENILDILITKNSTTLSNLKSQLGPQETLSNKSEKQEVAVKVKDAAKAAAELDAEKSATEETKTKPEKKTKEVIKKEKEGKEKELAELAAKQKEEEDLLRSAGNSKETNLKNKHSRIQKKLIAKNRKRERTLRQTYEAMQRGADIRVENKTGWKFEWDETDPKLKKLIPIGYSKIKVFMLPNEELIWQTEVAKKATPNISFEEKDYVRILKAAIDKSILQLDKRFESFAKGGNLPRRKRTERVTLAITKFVDANTSAKERGDGEAIAYLLETSLTNIENFTIVERQRLETIVKEQELQLGGMTDTASAKKVGKLLNADILIQGSVARFGNKTIINVKAVDVERGEILLSKKAEAERDEDIPTLVDEFANKIALIYR